MPTQNSYNDITQSSHVSGNPSLMLAYGLLRCRRHKSMEAKEHMEWTTNQEPMYDGSDAKACRYPLAQQRRHVSENTVTGTSKFIRIISELQNKVICLSYMFRQKSPIVEAFPRYPFYNGCACKWQFFHGKYTLWTPGTFGDWWSLKHLRPGPMQVCNPLRSHYWPRCQMNFCIIKYFDSGTCLHNRRFQADTAYCCLSIYNTELSMSTHRISEVEQSVVIAPLCFSWECTLQPRYNVLSAYTRNCMWHLGAVRKSYLCNYQAFFSIQHQRCFYINKENRCVLRTSFTVLKVLRYTSDRYHVLAVKIKYKFMCDSSTLNILVLLTIYYYIWSQKPSSASTPNLGERYLSKISIDPFFFAIFFASINIGPYGEKLQMASPLIKYTHRGGGVTIY